MLRLGHVVNVVLVVLSSMVAGCSVTNPTSLPPPILTGQEILSADRFDLNQHYVIYLHGKIIEEQGPNAVHPEFGAYEYEEILEALGESGAQVVSEVRSGNTNATDYAGKVAGWVTHLLEGGVPPENITIIGFSKGAGITILVSLFIGRPGLNYVLIGICADEINDNPGLEITGRILSLYETSDEFGGSCQVLADRSPGVTSFDEVSFSTGASHGAFYRADDFWLNPIVDWIIAQKRE